MLTAYVTAVLIHFLNYYI